MLYRVLRDCYYANRYYTKGEEVELSAPHVPEHFVKIRSVAEKLAELSKQIEPTAETAGESVAENGDKVATDIPTESKADKELPSTDETVAEAKSLDKMTNFELRALAMKNGIDFPKNAKNAELIAAIRGE